MADEYLLPERVGARASRELRERRDALAALFPGSHGLGHDEATLVPLDRRTMRFGNNGGHDATLVHFHGGGFRQGQPEMVEGYARSLANSANIEVVCPSYRLAPEFPFPAAINDGMRCITNLAGCSRRLILAGDSAGGGLAASLALRCRELGIPVTGLVLHSPWMDLTVTDPCYKRNASTDTLFSKASASSAADLYLRGHDPLDPLASPLHADATAFPTTFISVGAGEVLHADAVSFAERLRAASVGVELCQVAYMDHVAVTRSLDLLGARHVMARTINFINRLVHAPGVGELHPE